MYIDDSSRVPVQIQGQLATSLDDHMRERRINMLDILLLTLRLLNVTDSTSPLYTDVPFPLFLTYQVGGAAFTAGAVVSRLVYFLH